MIDRIKELAKRFHKDTVDIRRYLHEFPGLSFEEYNAIQVIHNFLTSWNIEHKPMTPTGIVATIKGSLPFLNGSTRPQQSSGTAFDAVKPQQHRLHAALHRDHR